MPDATFHFPPNFRWGVATAAHQIEGRLADVGARPAAMQGGAGQAHLVQVAPAVEAIAARAARNGRQKAPLLVEAHGIGVHAHLASDFRGVQMLFHAAPFLIARRL